MKSTYRLIKSDLPAFKDWMLHTCKAEWVDVGDEWLSFRFRVKDRQWTQGYDGLTKQSKKPRDFYRVAGPEQKYIARFYQAKALPLSTADLPDVGDVVGINGKLYRCIESGRP